MACWTSSSPTRPAFTITSRYRRSRRLDLVVPEAGGTCEQQLAKRLGAFTRDWHMDPFARLGDAESNKQRRLAGFALQFPHLSPVDQPLAVYPHHGPAP